MFCISEGCLEYHFDHEMVRIEAWGENALRIRATRNTTLSDRVWALTEEIPAANAVISLPQEGQTEATITNGGITAHMDGGGGIRFTDSAGKLLLREDNRGREESTRGRVFRSISGDSWRLVCNFCPCDGEKLFGMGQYRQKYLDMKGCTLELAHRNSQISVPFYISNRGYGFLWNNPAIGKVTFGKNRTEWIAESTKELDYWIVAGEEPAELERIYTSVTGRAPMMPEYGMGYWQCKLRYGTQEEVLEVARHHKSLGLPMDVIIIDFFHWTREGEYKFDERCFPDVEGMCRDLKSLGIKLMVSVWPTVAHRSENFSEMMEQGLLVRTERGVRVTMMHMENTVFYDATNPAARQYVWKKCKENYRDRGVDLFWLDEAEPEYAVYDFDNYRYHLGSNLEVGNLYPLYYAKGFYDGLVADGEENPMSLVRCAWCGSAKYGALVWSGDVTSTFESFREQISAGLSMAVAGIPWWTTDIGGFKRGDSRDPAFKELLMRWFAWACFCPVMRMHGYREPVIRSDKALIQQGTGAPNEVWSYGQECFTIMKYYLLLREKMRPYIRRQMKVAHETGLPIMRPLFFGFKDDPKAWEVEDAYLFGPDILVAPVYEQGAGERSVYLPAGTHWQNARTGEWFAGGQTVSASAPLDVIPLFIREGGYNPLAEGVPYPLINMK